MNLTTPEWAAEIGRQFRALRLLKNLEQSTVAGQAGISVTALKNLESGKGATIATMIRTLKALGREDWLATLAPPISVSPMQLLRNKSPRQRARKSHKDCE